MTLAATKSFPAFLESLRESPNDVVISARSLASQLEIPIQTLADIAGVHRGTLSRSESSPKLQESLVDVVRVLSAATELNGGDVKKAIFWFRNHPIRDFSYQTAMQLVERGKVDAVIEYIESIGAGATG